jgi:hypothetical protein
MKTDVIAAVIFSNGCRLKRQIEAVGLLAAAGEV